MMLTRRTVKPRLVIVTIVIACGVGATAALPWQSSASTGLGELNSELGQQQAHAQSLAASINGLSHSIAVLKGQIALVRSRETEVRAQLFSDRRELRRIRRALRRERKLELLLQARLARARTLLSRQLVSAYESDKPDLVTVVLEARGFADLLDRINFLRQAEGQQQTLIQVTRSAKAQAVAAEVRLTKMEVVKARVTRQTATQARALAGMNALLHTRKRALRHIRYAREVALAASRARGQQLLAAIARIRAQQAAAAQAAQAAASSAPAGGSTGAAAAPAPASGASGGWVIPSAIVQCESGGQNLPPNSAGASGFYQILPSTWKGAGGTGPAAYLAPKSEQDAVAQRLWAGGAGASNWVCAGMVGIH